MRTKKVYTKSIKNPVTVYFRLYATYILMEKSFGYLVYTANVKWKTSKDQFSHLINLEIRETFKLNFQGT